MQINEVGEEQWKDVEVTAESGSVVTVDPNRKVHCVSYRARPRRLRGIDILTEPTVLVPTQTADMFKVLASVTQMVHAGNRGGFDLIDSYIEHKAPGRRTKLLERIGYSNAAAAAAASSREVGRKKREYIGFSPAGSRGEDACYRPIVKNSRGTCETIRLVEVRSGCTEEKIWDEVQVRMGSWKGG